MLGHFVAAVAGRFLGLAWPAFASYKALESRSAEAVRDWFTYWIVFGVFKFAEVLLDLFLCWVPFYYALKVLFVVYLWAPHTKGALFIYSKYLQPLLLHYEPDIDGAIEAARLKAATSAHGQLRRLFEHAMSKFQLLVGAAILQLANAQNPQAGQATNIAATPAQPIAGPAGQPVTSRVGDEWVVLSKDGVPLATLTAEQVAALKHAKVVPKSGSQMLSEQVATNTAEGRTGQQAYPFAEHSDSTKATGFQPEGAPHASSSWLYNAAASTMNALNGSWSPTSGSPAKADSIPVKYPEIFQGDTATMVAATGTQAAGTMRTEGAQDDTGLHNHVRKRSLRPRKADATFKSNVI